MTAAPRPSPPPPQPTPPPDPPSRPTVAFWPVFTWLALQMLALLAAGFRVPFSAGFPVPAERLAVHEMIVVQALASALLFPMLFRTLATGAVVVASAPVMTQLAGVLAASPIDWPTRLAVCAYPAIWLIALGLWAIALRTPRAQMYGVAAATLVVVGGAVWAYVSREFGAPMQPFDWAGGGYMGPIVGAMALIECGARTGTVWVFLGLTLLTGAAAAGVRWRVWKTSPSTPSRVD